MATANTSVAGNTDSDFLIDAAFQLGERTGNDEEFDALKCFLREAFDLLNSDQKQRFFSSDAVRTCLKSARVAVPEAGQQNPAEVAAARVGIRLEGGVIQTVFSNVPIQVDVIDYDLDNAPPESFADDSNMVIELMQVNGERRPCVLARYGAHVLPSEFPKIDEALWEAAKALPSSPGP